MHEKQLKILELAGRIQYFITPHLWRAGIYTTTSTTSARNHIRDLMNYGFITRTHYGVTAGAGKLHPLYSLTPKAVRYLVEVEGHEPERIKSSKSNKNQEWETKAPSDYFHRVGVLDSVLSLLLAIDSLEVREDFLELYFRRFGMHQPRRTTFELSNKTRLEPDAVLSFRGDGKNRLYLLEFYEDTTNNERIKRSLARHALAIHEGTPTTALGLDVGHRVLLVFRHEHMARAIIQYIKEESSFHGIGERFLFKTHASIESDAMDNWADFQGKRVNLF